MFMSEQLSHDFGPEREAEVGAAVIGYILYNDLEGLPLEFRGPDVFGAIASLRKNNGVLHGEHAELDEDQAKRLEEIEMGITWAVRKNMHYYPFGHDRNITKGLPEAGVIDSSWGTSVRASSRRHLLHEKPLEPYKFGEIVPPTRKDYEV